MSQIITSRELKAIQRFNRLVVNVQAWYICRSAVDAPVNDILLIQRLNELQDAKLQAAGLKMMLRHSWYLSPELATLANFLRLDLH